MSRLLYLDEDELSLIFKSIQYYKNYEASIELNNLWLKLNLLHGDLNNPEEEEE